MNDTIQPLTRGLAEMKKGKMKRLVCMILASAMLMMSSAALADRAIVAHRASTVTIDGDLSEWNISSPAVIDAQEQVVRDLGQWIEDGAADCSVQVYMMWDDANLYLAATIMDDTPFMYREGFPPDMADSLVLFLSTDPAADSARTAYAANDFRVTMIIDDYYYNTGVDREMVADKKGYESKGADGDEQVLDGYEACIQEIEGGYTFECVIPWANFAADEIPVLVPAAGMTLGVDFGMFDLDFPCPGVATVRMQWAGTDTVDTDPSQWGCVTLGE